MNEELQQQLMEFVYGLLDEDEANALCARITSDPEVARAYSKVKLQCDLVGRAARYDIPKVAWIRPDVEELPSASPHGASKMRSADSYRRLANWCLGVAALGLLCLVGSAYLFSPISSRNDLAPAALTSTKPLQVVLTGPSTLNAEASSPFSIQIEDELGTPVSTTLNYRLYDTDGAVNLQGTTASDESGLARFDVDAAVARRASRLELTAADGSPTPLRRDLDTAPERFVTYMRMDRPLYQPGEQIFYRSVTLSQFGLRSERELETSFEIVDSSDRPVANSANTIETEHGVGRGAFALPDDLPEGTYTLIASSPDNLFRDEWRDFHVRRFEAPRLLKKLELAQDSYSLGDQVDLDFSVERVAGEPLAERPLQVQATLDGVELATPEAKTDAEGKSRFSLQLPETIERGQASVSVTVQTEDDSSETITKDIPINLGKVNVDFYPEGGELAAELPSRVYFYARDPLGKPTHIEGHIVDSRGDEITDVVTRHEGRGVFAFAPAADEHYRLMIEKPSGVTKEVPLPEVSLDRFASIETGPGVFEADAPIAFTLHQLVSPKPLIVAAYCRGAMVGQLPVDPGAYALDDAPLATFRGTIPLSDQAQGVVRLTVFDPSSTPPTPIAERLVYRRVHQSLDVQLTPDAATFAPGQAVQLDLAVRDEDEAPVPAVLGITIVDDAVLSLADDKSVRMPTYFHLLTEIESPEQLEDANFYLGDQAESVAALDTLLGTQGWRRFTELPATQFAQTGGGGFGGGGASKSFLGARLEYRRSRGSAAYEEAPVPLSVGTTLDVTKIISRKSSRVANGGSSSGKWFAVSIVVSSIVLLVLVGVTSWRGARSNRGLRVVAVAVALGSLVVGVISLPMKVPRARPATEGIAPAGGEFDRAANEQDPEAAEQRFGDAADSQSEGQLDRFMFEGEPSARSEAAMDAAPFESESFAPAKGAPSADDHRAAPKQQLGRADDAAIPESADERPLGEKKQAKRSADMPPSPAESSPPRPAAEPMAERPMTLAEQSRDLP
ncbi:MAG: MG2 domain-containing protein, partial [Pirellulaceae bacterium]